MSESTEVDDFFDELCDKHTIEAKKCVNKSHQKALDVYKGIKTIVEKDRDEEKDEILNRLKNLKKEYNKVRKNIKSKNIDCELNKLRSLKRSDLMLQIRQVELELEDLMIEEEGRTNSSDIKKTGEQNTDKTEMDKEVEKIIAKLNYE